MKRPWTREREAEQVARCVEGAKGRRAVANVDEADEYRLAAQLLATFFPNEALMLDRLASEYYAMSAAPQRSFPQMIEDDLVMDLPRLRKLLEEALMGVNSW